MEVTFSFASLDKAEKFDPSWVNAQDLCGLKGSDVEGGVGPFGLLTLASENLEEFTPVFFRIFKAPQKHVVLLCSDAKWSITLLFKLTIYSIIFFLFYSFFGLIIILIFIPLSCHEGLLWERTCTNPHLLAL